MRKELVLLSALTCLTGGAALLAPASGQRRYPACGALVNSDCPETSEIQVCADDHGNLRRLVCGDSNTWELLSPH